MFGDAVIASVNDCVSLPPPLSVSLTVKLFVPAVEGIPLISPVRGFSKRTGGSLCSAHKAFGTVFAIGFIHRSYSG